MSKELVEDPKPSLSCDRYTRESYLTKRGYAIIKNTFSEEEIKKIKRDLTVKPFVNKDYGPDSKPFPVYLESKKKIYVPKFYGIDKIGSTNQDKIYHGVKIDCNFVGDIRDKQRPVVNKFLESISDDGSNGGIISVGCGFGKTVLSIYLISKIRKKTLVIVHKEFLLSQWKERISEFMPSASVGIIQGSKIDTEGHDIVIGMLQSISMKEYSESVFSEFGFCIIDECHHIGAEVFSRSLPKINSKYMLGLSATPKRKDGLSKVFEWYIGPYLYRQKNNDKEKKNVEVRQVYYEKPLCKYNREETNQNGKVSIPKMITNISECERRNNLILKTILSLCEDPKRKVLILGDRRDQLYELSRGLENNHFTNWGYYIGGMKEVDLKKSETKQVLLATYSMSSEGMDIPALNSLFLITPKSDIEQSIGRILRKNHADVIPIIYDYVDTFSIFNNQSVKRTRFYNKNKYIIKRSRVLDSDIESYDELMKLQDKFVVSETKKKIKKENKCLL